MPGEPLTAEEQVIRDWLDGQLSPSGSPLPPSRRRSQPLPRRQVTAVVATLIGLLDAARAALPPVAPDGADLDAAWAEAEAALPEGWRVSTLMIGTDDETIPEPGPEPYTEVGEGTTPAAALRELARRLRAGEGGET